MILVIISIVIVMILFAYVKHGNIYNPVTLFCGFMGLICTLASFQFFEMNQTSIKVQFIVTLGILGFVGGCALVNTVYKRSAYNNASSALIEKDSSTINIKLLNTLVCCMTIYSVLRFINVLPLLLQGFALDYIRLVYFGVEVNGISVSGINSIIEIFINLPLLYAIIPIVILDILSGEERKISFITVILSIIWVSLSTIISGGRFLIFIVAIEVIFTALILNKIPKVNKHRTKFLILLITVVCIIFMYYMSINRMISREYDFLYSLYIYFTGCFPHMSHRIESIDISANYTYGVTFFSGLLRPLMLIYKWINGSFPEVYQRTLDIGVELQTPVDIGTGKTFNAFATNLYYFYYDGGYIGVIIDSILYGLICQYVYLRMRINMTRLNIALYLLVIQGIFTSMIRHPFVLVYYTYAFMVVILIYTRVGKKR